MKQVWKFKIEPKTELELPVGFEILCVQLQKEVPHVWVLLNSEEPNKESMSVIFYGTGHDIPDNHGKYIGTFQLDSLGYHVFSIRNKK